MFTMAVYARDYGLFDTMRKVRVGGIRGERPL